MNDDYARQLYTEQLLRSQEAQRQATEWARRAREAVDMQIYWQQFYRYFDQQREQLLDQTRAINEALARQQQDSAFSPDPAPQMMTPAMEAEQPREYAQVFQKPFSESPAIQAVWEAAKLSRNPNAVSSFETVRNRFWQAVNAAETPEAQHVQKMLVAAGYQIRDGTLAPILAMPEYGITADNMGQRRADLVLSIDHADPRKLPPGVEVPGRGRELSPKEALDSEFLRFMPVRDNSSRGNRYDPEDKPFTGEFPKGRSHRREWMTKAALQMLERAQDAKDNWLYWQLFFKFFDTARDALLDREKSFLEEDMRRAERDHQK